MLSVHVKILALLCVICASATALPITPGTHSLSPYNSSLPSIRASAPIQKFQKICVTNDAGFVLHWWMRDLIQGTQSEDSGPYP
jgi:hypothetical protein